MVSDQLGALLKWKVSSINQGSQNLPLRRPMLKDVHFRPLDTIGIFTRDIDLAATVMETWLSRELKRTLYLGSPRIVWAEDLGRFDSRTIRNTTDRFSTLLESFVGFNRVSISLNQLWIEYSKTNTTLENYFDKVRLVFSARQ